MFQNRWSFCLVFVLACGGGDQSNQPDDAPDAAPPAPKPAWLMEANLPGIDAIDSAVGLADAIYLGRTNSTEAWALDTISKSVTRLPNSTGSGSLLVVDKKLARSGSNHVWLFSDGEWVETFLPSLQSRPNVGRAWHRGRLFQVGGLTSNSGDATNLVDQLRLPVGGTRWADEGQIADFPWRVALPHVISDASAVWAISHGRVTGPRGMAMYAPADNAWTEVDLPEGLDAHSVAHLSGYLYVASTHGVFVMSAKCSKWSVKALDYPEGVTQPPVLASNARGLFAVGGDPLTVFRMDLDNDTVRKALPQCAP